ncbi:hypothetical protein CH299_12145 [Rhodococcus sp. 14-2686-1-2]|nr:hypothetical protein CH301_11595 [Rhodococcus sp. 15-1189-1-1a]OZF15537.1 hypothetical protein CH299_12145 [Rhodococcus sp. 14-2686-1-2]
MIFDNLAGGRHSTAASTGSAVSIIDPCGLRHRVLLGTVEHEWGAWARDPWPTRSPRSRRYLEPM